MCKNCYCECFYFVIGPTWHRLVAFGLSQLFLASTLQVLKIIVTRGAFYICMHPTVPWSMPNLENKLKENLALSF